MGLMTDPVFIPPWLYDAASKAGHDLTGFEKQQPIPQVVASNVVAPVNQAFSQRNPLEKMNRKQRRAAMKRTGHTWASARALALRKAHEEAEESKLAAQASRLTPEQARQALAEWAKRGGRPRALHPLDVFIALTGAPR